MSARIHLLLTAAAPTVAAALYLSTYLSISLAINLSISVNMNPWHALPPAHASFSAGALLDLTMITAWTAGTYLHTDPKWLYLLVPANYGFWTVHAAPGGGGIRVECAAGISHWKCMAVFTLEIRILSELRGAHK